MSPKLAAAAALLVGGLALTACSSSAAPAPGRAAQPPSSAAATGGGAPSTGGAPSDGGSASTGGSSTGGSSTGGSSTGGSSSTGGGNPTASAVGSTTGGSSGTGGSTAAPSAAECTASQLTVAQTNPSVGAGQYYSTLTFTNTSGHTCSLTGYPGVSYVPQANGQSGNPAARTGDPYRTVTLAPGGTAHAAFHDANGVSGYDPGQCALAPATGLKVYPPDQRTALFLPWQTEHCTGPSIHAATIGPITG
ncbi:DUF4232 domain-containing protein [Kitasatospora viridis]|uniref:Uncharacterized protein DUF4232 n=1 Tax=Kitasatospora viridis TaxID=281105 RepID=A0A561UN10_9ACTN|nr:DUF4232 domain-containing protein [Kitasatospora viridis]TWG00751.1 uncharacterized protein DUF4232 [Kitasatospora viridis]